MGAARILRHDVIDSTQFEARRLLDDGPQRLPFAVVAREQTAGRGRRGRAWASPRGGLWVTSAWPLPADLDPALGLRVGMAALDAMGDVLSAGLAARLQLKWPNDIMIDGGKAAGVLTEAISHPDYSQRIGLIGTGINANIDRAHLPDDLRGVTAILRELTNADLDLDRLLDTLHTRQSRAINTPEPLDETIARANARLHRRGERLALIRPDTSAVTGTLAALDDRAEPILLDEHGDRLPGPFTGFASRDEGHGSPSSAQPCE